MPWPICRKRRTWFRSKLPERNYGERLSQEWRNGRFACAGTTLKKTSATGPYPRNCAAHDAVNTLRPTPNRIALWGRRAASAVRDVAGAFRLKPGLHLEEHRVLP